MKVTKSQLKQFIKEELEKVLEIEKFPRGEYPAVADEPKQKQKFPRGEYPAVTDEPKQKTDVARAAGKLEKTPQLGAMLQKIDNRVELEQFLGVLLKAVGQKLGPADVRMALMKAAKVAASSQ